MLRRLFGYVNRLWPRWPNGRARSLALLRENLSPDQRAQFEAHGYFEVVGGETGARYRIHVGSTLNVAELDRAGRPIVGLCFYAGAWVPIGDVLLAQKLALESLEGEALAIANRFRWPYGPRVSGDGRAGWT